MCKRCVLLGALVNAGIDHRTIIANDDKDDKRKDDNNTDNVTPFETIALSPFDFVPHPYLIRHMRDEAAQAYLQETIDLFHTTAGIDFTVLQVESDGSCLPHAISRCLVGHELYYNALRFDLYLELQRHAAWYKRVLNTDAEGNAVYDDAEWQNVEWKRLLHAAEPTHGQPAGPERWLGPEHVLGLANVLGRPILLLNTPVCMANPHDGHRGGLFLPLRRSRAEILKQHAGTFPSPLTVGYANAMGNHYVALVQTRSVQNVMQSLSEPVKHMWQQAWSPTAKQALQVPLTRPLAVKAPMVHDDDDDDETTMVMAQHPITKRRMHLLLPPATKTISADTATTTTITHIYPAWADLVADGMSELLQHAPSTRQRTLDTLQKYIANLIAAKTNGGPNMMEQIAKVSTIRVDKQAGCRWITSVSGAQTILEACGYQLDQEGQRLVLGRPPLCQKNTTNNNQEDEEKTEDELRREEGLPTNDDVHALEHISRLLALLTKALEESENNDKGQVAGNPGLESKLFGPLPRYSWLGVGPEALTSPKTGKTLLEKWPDAIHLVDDDDKKEETQQQYATLWKAARTHYGAGLATKPDGVWTFGSGQDSIDFCQRTSIELEARFVTLTQGKFGSISDALRKLVTSGDIVVQCPSCGNDCISFLPPQQAMWMDDEDCTTFCPHDGCGARLNLKQTFRRYLFDTVAAASRGALGGVWKCPGHVEADETCNALNVGDSYFCAACGASNPAQKKRTLDMMIKVLTESLTTKTDATTVTTTTTTVEESVEYMGLAPVFTSRSSSEESRKSIKSEYDLGFLFGILEGSETTSVDTSRTPDAASTPPKGVLPPMPELPNPSRAVSSPATLLQVRPKAAVAASPPTTVLRMTAALSKTFTAGRTASVPVTSAEKLTRQSESGIDHESLTRHAAMELLKGLANKRKA